MLATVQSTQPHRQSIVRANVVVGFNEAEANRLGNLAHCNLLNSNSGGWELRALPILAYHGTAHRGVATSIAANKP